MLLIIGSAGIGISKCGFSGVSMLHVIVFAFVFGTKASTGIILPMLIIGDCLAIYFFGKTAQWGQIRKLLPPALIGVVIGSWLMKQLDESAFKPLVGCIILTLTAIQVYRIRQPNAFENIPHNKLFAWTLGLLAGITTMMANAAGPVVALYLLAVALPKMQFVGTGAWFFLVVNVFKLPFSFYMLDLIGWESLSIDLLFSPVILLGMLVGRWLVKRIPQKQFDIVLLALTAIAAVRLVVDPIL